MRSFIQACATLFVVAGIAIMALTALLALFLVLQGTTDFFQIPMALGGIFAGASLALVGGGTYMVCQIDERLEAVNGPLKKHSGSRSSAVLGKFDNPARH
jgi:hypothetical protein